MFLTICFQSLSILSQRFILKLIKMFRSCVLLVMVISLLTLHFICQEMTQTHLHCRFLRTPHYGVKIPITGSRSNRKVLTDQSGQFVEGKFKVLSDSFALNWHFSFRVRLNSSVNLAQATILLSPASQLGNEYFN